MVGMSSYIQSKHKDVCVFMICKYYVYLYKRSNDIFVYKTNKDMYASSACAKYMCVYVYTYVHAHVCQGPDEEYAIMLHVILFQAAFTPSTTICI